MTHNLYENAAAGKPLVGEGDIIVLTGDKEGVAGSTDFTTDGCYFETQELWAGETATVSLAEDTDQGWLYHLDVRRGKAIGVVVLSQQEMLNTLLRGGAR